LLHADANVFLTDGNRSSLSQTISFNSGDVLYFEYYGYDKRSIDGSTANWGVLYDGWFDLVNSSNPAVTHNAWEWTAWSIPPGDHTIQFWVSTAANLGYRDDFTYSNLLVDNVFIKSVPEPSTLILVGIGAIGLLAYTWRQRI
jgi:hypothetical protein